MLIFLNQLWTCVNFPKKGVHYVMDNSIGFCSTVEPRYPDLNSFPIEEFGNWCHQTLVGAPQKYQAQNGGSMATL